jgi:hypothetical protein
MPHPSLPSLSSRELALLIAAQTKLLHERARRGLSVDSRSIANLAELERIGGRR